MKKTPTVKAKRLPIAADSHFFRPIKMALLREGAPPPCTYETETETSHELAPLAQKNGYGSSRLDPNEPADAIPYEI